MKCQNAILLSCLALSACSLLTNTQIEPLTATRDLTRFASQTPLLLSETTTPEPVSQSPIPATPTPLPTDAPERTDSPDDLIVFPTATYLVPTPIAEARYRLVNWTPELANQLIATLQEYPDNLGFAERGYHDFGYYAAYHYVLFAEREAQQRFSRSTFTEDWAWDASYNMAQIGDPGAVEAYAHLINQALNTGITDAERIGSWFKSHETRLQLKVSALPQLAGQPENYLAEISDAYQASGAYLWLVRGKSSFSAYPLQGSDHGGYGDFGFSSAEGVDAEWRDVTGDGIAEIITTHKHFPGSGDALTTSFDVFDISHIPPVKIRFMPPIPAGRERTWSVLQGNNKAPSFQFEFVFDRMVCPFTIVKEYQWNANAFQLIGQTFPDKAQVIEQAGVECLDMLVSSLLFDLQDGDTAMLNDLDKLIAGWPYSTRQWWPNDDNAPDARDKARFIMGLYLALNGQVDAARKQMSNIVANPVITASSWITPANEFLMYFHTPDDLPDACVATSVCRSLLPVGQLIALARTSKTQDVVDFLRQVGVDISASGPIDANDDGRMDEWITVGPSNDNPSVWLFITADNGEQAFSLGNWFRNGPTAFRSHPPFQGFPVFSMESNSGMVAYTFYSDPATSEIRISTLCDRITATLDDVENDLLVGDSPARIIEKLSDVGPLLEFACRNPFSTVEYTTPHWRYLLGLAYEYAGDSEHAAENYLALWQSHPDSPFAIMSRSKLDIAP